MALSSGIKVRRLRDQSWWEGIMQNRTPKRFKDDIRRTLAVYALIPAVVITLFSYLLSFYILQRTVVNRNLSVNRTISQKLEELFIAYSEQVMLASSMPEVADCVVRSRNNIDIYRKMYAFVNQMEVKGKFYIFNSELMPIVASSTILPEYARRENAFKWGITARLQETPERVVIEKQVSEETGKKILSIGKAIVSGEEIIGYITFDLDEKDLGGMIKEKFSTDVIITDRFGNVIVGTNDLLINKYGKIDDNFRDRTGKIKTEKDRHYISQTPIMEQRIIIYAITSIGHIGNVMLLTGFMLAGLFLMLILLSQISAKKIAESKTKVIDDIIEAIENVQNGKLDRLLNISTNDEFEVIAASYNQMLEDIKNLIEVNKEKARQSSLSEIKKLESQFNPHFLFNTLEMIRYMVRMDPGAVDKIIVSLSNLLRYSINNTINEVTIKEDIEYTKNYLLIQKYRFGKRFHYSINIDESLYDCIVPKLIVQPMIENAIKYGFENRQSLTIQVKASYTENDLVIVIYDDGAGMQPEVLEEVRTILRQNNNASSHIGLYNVHRRIQLMYGEKYGLDVMSETNGGTVVRISLPVNRSDACA